MGTEALDRPDAGLPPQDRRAGRARRTARAALGLVSETFVAWDRDNAASLAASLAFYAVLAIAPLLMILTALLDLLFGEQAARGQLVAQVRGFLGEDGAVAIQSVLQHAARAQPGLGATVVGSVTLLVAVSGLFAELRTSLNLISGRSPAPWQGLGWLLRDRLQSFAMVFGLGLLLLVSLALGAAVELFEPLRLPAVALAVWTQATTLVLSWGVLALLFSFFLRVGPTGRASWRDVWIGSAVTALLLWLGRVAIGLYLGWSSVASAYGAASSLMALLVWVYYSAQLLFLGAELTKCLSLASQRLTPARAVDSSSFTPARLSRPTTGVAP